MDTFSPRLVVTKDGSHSLYAPRFDQHYHSLSGSLRESLHIYIDLGLRPFLEREDATPVRVFEMGLGTGLNALLTWQLSDEAEKSVHYVAVEAYPLTHDQIESLNYEALTGHAGLSQLHGAAWGEPVALSPYFTFTRYFTSLQNYSPESACFDVVYYDAFSPEAQPELWTEDLFRKVAAFTAPGGSLVTYCTKGDVKRALRSAGFQIQKHPGPWGKRDVLRAVRQAE
jgi:tRNA U34 5-methylaminomethyl-2-thiouridine-forming methyltransferase MnmC